MSKLHPLRRYRDANGLAEDALAEQLGVAVLTIKRWEEAVVLPQVEMRKKIKAVTGIPFSEFVAFVESSSQEDAA